MDINLTVIDPGMGNLRSVCRAWEHCGAQVKLAATPDEIGEPDGLIFPGQGAIVDCMAALKATGFDDALKGWIKEDRPFFGICLGLQALFEHSEEGDTPGLGIFTGTVQRFRLEKPYKIPHMGWNTVNFKKQSETMLAGLKAESEHFYFVHSYHVKTEREDIIWCESDYGYRFVSGIWQGNCMATQFHPEKSQAKGLQIYTNFLQLLQQMR